MYEGAFWIVTDHTTGGFIGVLEFEANKEKYVLGSGFMLNPNVSGKPPEPSHDMIVPANSPRIVVGIGVVNSALVVHEQYWRRSDDSATLAPGEKREFSVTVFEGVETTSSTSEEVSEVMGFSASAGWGAISTALNASMATTSTSLQQISLTEQTTTFETFILRNKTDQIQMHIKWQLIDSITIGSTNISTAQRPSVLAVYAIGDGAD